MEKSNTGKKAISIRKLAMAGVLVAVAVVGSLFSFPVAGSKCAPVQHMVNICGAVFLGPAWGVAVAFCAQRYKKPHRTRKPHGISGKHGWSTLLWPYVQIQQKDYPDMYCRGTRNRGTWRTGSISPCKIRDAHTA